MVASFTDAWIETRVDTNWQALDVSHLLQMRGLKLSELVDAKSAPLSHLLQMRGLKRFIRLPLTIDARRIFYRCVD